jgi:hypothetical protein
MRTNTLLIVIGLTVVVGLPLAGTWARRHSAPRCEHDGLPVEASYRVRVVDADGERHEFCCVQCASLWLAQPGHDSQQILVTDEKGGGEIDARSASFVRSPVVTNPVTGNRIHVFRDSADAEEHVRAFGGRILSESESAFAE